MPGKRALPIAARQCRTRAALLLESIALRHQIARAKSEREGPRILTAYGWQDARRALASRRSLVAGRRVN